VLEDVTVMGTDERLVLDRVSLTIPAGAFVAITGASGSGRSTLAAVIAGVTLPSSGSAQVGGEPAHQAFGPGGFHRAVLGHARPAMLGDDLDELISLGVDKIDPETIRHAARQAHIIDVVDALPLGFSTPISDLPLSGGELQRLALAQALARDTGLLVLDDVTSSLDPATEREVISALLAARGHRTLVVVTNREAVLSRADQVVHLEARTSPPFVAAGAPR
jgi:ATP-binding cassette subfamily B protein